MTRSSLSVMTVLLISLTLTACGGGSSAPPTFVTQILSDPVADGYIVNSAGTFTVIQGNTQSVFAGVDPTTGAESRAFLDFPLTGTGGVPGNAVILSAIVDIVINNINPQPLNGMIPIRIDLVSIQPPTLIATDYDRTLQPAIMTTTINPPISQADFGNHVPIDVTPLMAEVQSLGLSNFQLRILEDFGTATFGIIEITDTTGPDRPILAPLLQVTYQ